MNLINTRTQELSLLSKDDIDNLASHFDSSRPYDIKNGMKKVYPDFGRALIESIINMDGYDWIGGNFYEHEHPYFPHVDRQKDVEGNMMVMVVPIRYTGRMPNLVIFDQEYFDGAYTWLMDWKPSKGSKISQYDTNKAGAENYPALSNITKKTGKPIPTNLAAELDMYPKEMLHSLSGRSHSFRPGNVIMFDGARIHATSKLEGPKLGLTLRYAKK